MQWNYLGRILNTMAYFPVLQLEDAEDPTLDWGEDDYKPYNRTEKEE